MWDIWILIVIHLICGYGAICVKDAMYDSDIATRDILDNLMKEVPPFADKNYMDAMVFLMWFPIVVAIVVSKIKAVLNG